MSQYSASGCAERISTGLRDFHFLSPRANPTVVLAALAAWARRETGRPEFCLEAVRRASQHAQGEETARGKDARGLGEGPRRRPREDLEGREGDGRRERTV